HAGFTRQAGGYDDNVGISSFFIRVCSDEFDVKAINRSSLCEVKRLALGRAFNNINKNDIRKLFACDPMCGSGTDIPGTDNRNLISSSHYVPLFKMRLKYELYE